jgi:hypothetical protein
MGTPLNAGSSKRTWKGTRKTVCVFGLDGPDQNAPRRLLKVMVMYATKICRGVHGAAAQFRAGLQGQMTYPAIPANTTLRATP